MYINIHIYIYTVVGQKFVPFSNKLHKEYLWKPERTLAQARPANPPTPLES